MELYWEWLCSIPGIYHAQQEVLLRCFGTPQGVWEASDQELIHLEKQGCQFVQRVRTFRQTGSPDEIRHGRERLGIQFISSEHEDFPKKLLTLRDCPFGLFYKGSLPDGERRAAAVVGARMCTPRGKRLAEQISRHLVWAGGQVVSGAAYGIDGAAQWAAAEQQGASYAVLGCGADQCYPAAHAPLLERLVECGGGVISEFPPGTPPLKTHFPLRNRIISGLSDLVIVVEARLRSGSLITAGYAAEQGRSVMAVPGRPEDELSAGCNELIALGADIILSADDPANVLFPDYKGKNKQLSEDIALAPAEKLVYSSLGLHTKSLWELEESTSLTLPELSDSLLSLEFKGLVRETERNYYARMK